MQIDQTGNMGARNYQIARSIEMVNNLNQSIVDQSQNLNGKMMKINVEQKVSAQINESKINLLA